MTTASGAVGCLSVPLIFRMIASPSSHHPEHQYADAEPGTDHQTEANERHDDDQHEAQDVPVLLIDHRNSTCPGWASIT